MLGAVLVVGGVALAVLVLSTVSATAASWSRHVLAASLIHVALSCLGVALALAAHRGGLALAVFWIVPVTLIWVGVEGWVDWREFYDRNRPRYETVTPGQARLQGTAALVFGVLALLGWLWVWRDRLRKRRSDLRA